MGKPAVSAILEASICSLLLPGGSVCAYWTMSGSGAPPEASEGPVLGRASYHRRHHRKHWLRANTRPPPQQPLDRYKWRTSARLAPWPAERPPTEGAEPAHLRVFSLPRLATPPNRTDGSGDQSQERPGPLRRIFLRSLSEPGAGNGAEKVALSKVGSDAEQRAPPFSSFISSLSRRISRALRDEARDEAQAEGGQSGRRVHAQMMIVSVEVT